MKPKRRAKARVADRPASDPRPADSPTSPKARGVGLRAMVTGILIVAGVAWLGSVLFKAPTPRSPPAAQATSLGQGLSGEAEVARQIARGNQLLAQGKTAEALEVFKETARLAPDDEDVHYNLGIAFARLGKPDEAISAYEEAIRIFPDYAEAHNNLGNVLLRLGRWDESLRHFERAVQITPEFAAGWNNLGTALQQCGKTNEAREYFATAVRLNPDYWQAQFNLGNSHLEAGNLEQARTALETVLRLQPNFEPAKLALQQLESRASTAASGPVQ